MILLDTHVVIWFRTGDSKLGRGARTLIDEAWEAEDLAVSAITFWEVAMLRSKGRLSYPQNITQWRQEQLNQGTIEIPVDGEIGIRAYSLQNFHPDPADRIIVATALEGHQLLTADELILEWSGNLDRMDARQ